MKNFMRILSLAFSVALLLWGFNACTPVEPAGIKFSSISESGFESSGTQTVTINLDKSIASDVTIEFTFSGTATASSDYGYFTTETTIPAGSTSTDISFSIYDNYEYDPNDKTLVITLSGISGSGVDDVEFGENTTYTYTLKEDDVAIDLTWTSSTGTAGDFDLDLELIDGFDSFVDGSSSSSDLTETVHLDGSYSDGSYYAIAELFSGPTSTSSATYTMTVKLPDGSTQSHNDVFDINNFTNRTLWGITKSGSSYTLSQDSFGFNGRGAIVSNRPPKNK